jgi:adenylate cyclase
MLEFASQNSHRAGTEQRELTLLFADLRDFTEISAELEIERTDRLLSQVMDCLTAAVLDHRGLVVDYYGDGLAAMWNAPDDQAEHPDLACSAALAMIETLPAIAAKWARVIERDLSFGIGVHTGIASVGNAGSTRQTKYGPRGPNVHLASRIEAASKVLGLPLVASQATSERLSGAFARHRICRARLPGMQQAVDLFTLHRASEDAHRLSAWRRYDDALRHFEDGRLAEAGCLLAGIEDSTADVPVSFLSARVEQALGARPRRRRTDRTSDVAGGVVWLDGK